MWNAHHLNIQVKGQAHWHNKTRTMTSNHLQWYEYNYTGHGKQDQPCHNQMPMWQWKVKLSEAGRWHRERET